MGTGVTCLWQVCEAHTEVVKCVCPPIQCLFSLCVPGSGLLLGSQRQVLG